MKAVGKTINLWGKESSTIKYHKSYKIHLTLEISMRLTNIGRNIKVNID